MNYKKKILLSVLPVKSLIPKVSICIPTYKQTYILKQTLDSILKQTFEDYEVIITDDTPDDTIKNFIDSYKNLFGEKLKYKKNSVSLGSPENWNEAIRLSKGEYIKIVHHDDYFTFSDSLQAFVDLMDNSPNAVLGFSSSVVYWINRNEKWIHSPLSEDLDNLKVNPYSLFFKNFIGAPSATIFRRSSNVFFDKNLKWVVDFEFYSRILKNNNVFAYDSRELITTVGDDHNITNECKDNKYIEIKEYVYLYKKIPFKNMQFKKSFHFFENLFVIFKVFSVKDIKSCGYEGRIPLLVYFALFKNKMSKISNKLYPRRLKMRNILRKIKKYLWHKNPSINANDILYPNVFIGKDCAIIDSKFGKHNKINDHSYLYKTTYGDYSYSSINVTIMNCSIGKFCSIAQGVSIGLGKHPLNDFVSTHPSFYSVHKQCGFSFTDVQYFNEMGFVTIGNDVWIGANAIILDDVKIGNGAVIAANSVVTKDVPAYAIVGGTPTTIIKYRFPAEDIIFLEKFQWWDKDSSWLQENFKLLHDIAILKSVFK